jgi:hypothetical protein
VRAGLAIVAAVTTNPPSLSLTGYAA